MAIEGFGFDGASFAAYAAKHCTPDAPGRLIMVEKSPMDWKYWECHNGGDEVVIVIEGRGEFLQIVDGEERRFRFGPGSAVLNPRGVWHTANVSEAMKAVYITPIPGTEHKAR